MNNILKATMSIFTFLFFISKANAVITISSDVNLSSGASYTNGSYGISVSTANGSLPWNVTTGGNIDLSGNQYGIMANSNSKLQTTGNSGTENMLINNSSFSGGLVGLNVSSGAELAINNMNIEYMNNTMPSTSGTTVNIFLRNSGGIVNITGNLSGNNTLKINDNISNGHQIMGILSDAANSTVNINNMSIEIKNNAANKDVIAIATTSGPNNIINISGVENGSNKLTITDNTSSTAGFRGVYNNNTNSEINIKYMDINISGNVSSTTNYAIQNVNNMSFIGSSGKNEFIIRNNTGSQVLGMFNSSGSKMTIENMNIYSGGNQFFAVVMDATFNMDNSSINMDDANTVFANNSGTSNINVTNGSEINTNGGALVYTFGGSAVTTNINADNSYIKGNTLSASGAVNNIKLENGSEWVMTRSSVLGTLTNNGSMINLRNAVSGQFNTLTLGSYVGTNGIILMNVELGDDASLTDKIVINGGGNISGSSGIEALVVGSNGNDPENNGIKIISAENGTTIDSNVFSLRGGQVDNSAYVYKLFQGDVDGLDSQSWYLRSTGVLSNTAQALANEPTAMVSIARTGMNSLQKRMGDLRENSLHNINGLWVRAYGNDLRVKDMISTDMTLYGTEAGYDQRWDYDGFKVYAGGMVGYMKVSDISNNYGNTAKDGEGDGNVYNLGVYGTVMGQNGWFIDGVIRNFFVDLDLMSYAASGQSIKYNLDRMMTAYSVEIGKQYKYCIACDTMITIEPKVEVMYAHADAKSFTSNLGNHIRYGNTDAFSTKAALTLGYKKKMESGMIIEPFIQAGIIEEWAGTTNVTFDGAKYKSDMGGTSCEFGGGLNMQLTGSTSFYSDIMYETGSNIRAVSGNVGMRFTW